MFIHEPGAECNAQMSCCLRHNLFQGISIRTTKDLKGMIVDNIKPQVDRFVFPDVHRVIVVASGRLLILSRGGAESVDEARSHDTATVQVEPAKELIRW